MTPFDQIGGLLGMDPEQLKSLMAQFAPSDDDRKAAKMTGLTQLGLGLLGARKGREWDQAGAAGQNALAARDASLQGSQAAKMQQFQMAEHFAKLKGQADAQRAAGALNQQLAGVDVMGAAGAPASVTNGAAPKAYESAMKKWQMAADAGDVKRAEEYRKAAEFLRVKYGLTPQTMMKGGTPVMAQLSEYGDPKELDGYAPKPEYKEVNTGKQTMFYDPLTGSQGGSFAMQTTPGQDQSAGLQRAQMAQTERHWQAGQGAGQKPQWDSTTGQFVYAPTADNPTGRAVQPQGYTPKPPEHTRRELDTIDAQIGIIKGAKEAAKATPSAFGMARGAATMAGATTESIAGRFDSAPERNARAYVYNVVSSAINERAGAAQSAQELSRLRSFLPAEMDNAKQVQDKLDAFETYLHDKRKAYAGAGKPQQAGKTVDFGSLPQ